VAPVSQRAVLVDAGGRQSSSPAHRLDHLPGTDARPTTSRAQEARLHGRRRSRHASRTDGNPRQDDRPGRPGGRRRATSTRSATQAPPGADPGFLDGGSFRAERRVYNGGLGFCASGVQEQSPWSVAQEAESFMAFARPIERHICPHSC